MSRLSAVIYNSDRPHLRDMVSADIERSLPLIKDTRTIMTYNGPYNDRAEH